MFTTWAAVLYQIYWLFQKLPKIDQKVKANPFAFCRILVILHKLGKGLAMIENLKLLLLWPGSLVVPLNASGWYGGKIESGFLRLEIQFSA